MHNLFLGELQRHCRDILGMDGGVDDPEKKRIPPHSTKEQEENIKEGLEAILRGSRSALGKLRKGYVIAFARANNVEPRNLPDEDVLKQQGREVISKQAYVDAILDWVSESVGRTFVIRCPRAFSRPVVDLSTAWSKAKTVVLNHEVLSEVWSDMAQTTLPSWMNRAPRNLGCASHGKLKADQWRTAGTVNLVITLCRLWGQALPTERERELLENYIALVTAVRWATMRSTSETHIRIVQQHLVQYLDGVVKLFGKAVLVTNHHLSLHIPECLRSFGPVHGWWSFPFERFNGILQRAHTNNKPDELELTFIRSFCRGSNLKSLLSRVDLPESFDEIGPLIQQYFTSDFKGTLLSDLAAMGAESRNDPATPDPTPFEVLNEDVYAGLLQRINYSSPAQQFQSSRNTPKPWMTFLQPTAQNRKMVKFNGIVFAIAKKHRGNSYILFKSFLSQTVRAGCIDQIFLHSRASPPSSISEFFLVIKVFCELPAGEVVHDPYRRYPLLDARLCYDSFEAQPIVIKLTDIVSHAATCPFTSDTISAPLRVILSLDRVSTTMFIPCLG
ncbi:hypothetical protein BV22DRAFT_1108228 [Leucogyrophana mollusca]|uniref:Uncharacterized protein n=1 Tax=Leucogyrophana mollusca TaxID=85980 RepID=A0ACB8B1J9_9AGAM|nr:hypothetical protein BV22DRAFT_1108228 [Leucogyrophana mollusca]